MAGNTAGRRRGPTWWCWCVVLTAGLGGQAFAGQNDLASATSRIRPVDGKAAALLRAGRERSTTFRHLTESIEQTDLIVYVETRPMSKLPSQLHLVSASPSARYVMVSIRVPGIDNDLVPWLAHELWHALEVAAAPEVRDGASLLQLYERIGGGYRAGDTVRMETLKAKETQWAVLSELRQPGAGRRADQSR